MNSSLDDADSVCNTGTPASPATPSADPRVTGVARTLGLPAPVLRVDASPAVPARSMPASVPRAPAPLAVPPPADAPVPTDPPELRSEERRVGEEWSRRWKLGHGR